MTNVPTIKGSAQARLILYRLFSLKLTEAEFQILSADPSQWEKILLMLEKAIDAEARAIADKAALGQAFSHIDRTTRDGLQRQIERLTGRSLWLGVHNTGLLESFVAEHGKLIKSVQREHLDKLSFAINRGIREARLQKDIVKDIRSMTNLGKKRAQLIARNAPLQYSGALTKYNQISAGIKSYIWQSSRDERVRDSHRKLDGEIFSWDEPGPHPRSEVNCRCDAVPLIN
jgi:SPP1 gp7 family putative phage head morphogenesis protein